MFFKRKKKKKDDDNQLMLFSREEMSGVEASSADPIPKDHAKDDQEKGAEGVAKEAKDGVNTKDDIDTIDIIETIETKGDKEVKEDDPFSPFIDDPASTSERIIHEMTAAMTLLDRFNMSQVRLIAMQAAPIAQSGVDFSQIYQLPSLPGFSMSGYSMLALSYVSFKRAFPGMIDRLDQNFTKEYEAALRQYKMG